MLNTLSFLATEAPGFALRGSQVRVITEPAAFYQVRSFFFLKKLYVPSR